MCLKNADSSKEEVLLNSLHKDYFKNDRNELNSSSSLNSSNNCLYAPRSVLLQSHSLSHTSFTILFFFLLLEIVVTMTATETYWTSAILKGFHHFSDIHQFFFFTLCVALNETLMALKIGFLPGTP